MTRLEWLQLGRLGRDGRDSRPKRRKDELENTTMMVRQQDENFYKLDLFAPVPATLKPCGFYKDTLTEATWLPYRNEQNEVMLKPSVLVTTKDMNKNKPFKIIDFFNDTHEIKGTFPSQELQTLMSVKAVQMLEHMATIEPSDIDKKIEDALCKHLSMPKAEMILAKRWIEGTFFYDIFDAYPIESILGVSESGKSRLCMVNLALAYHAEGMIDPSEASIFRGKEEDKVSLIIDESEYLNNPNLYSTLRILLNASYSKHAGYVTRYDEEDGRRVKRRFDLYSPMSISGIAGLEGVTLSRAFRLVMRRTNKDFPKAYVSDYQVLRDMLYVLRIRHCFEVHETYQKIDIGHIVTARFDELFRPLFTMTKFMGNQDEWNVLADWCKDYQDNFRAEALNVAQEEMILMSITKMTSEPSQPDWIELKTLTDTVNGLYNVKLASKTVSNILYRLGLTKRKKLHGLTMVFAKKELLENAASCIGLELPSQNTATTSTTSTKSTDPDYLLHAEEVKDETR